MDFLDAVDEEDSSSVCSSEHVPLGVGCSVDVHIDSPDDADDEHSQNSSPGVTVTPNPTPDLKSGPFKFPTTLPHRSSHQTSVTPQTSVSESVNDDGFFSGFDVDECLNEDMDIV